MPLAPGTRLGVYEITAQIGEGGMGAVCRATDTTLGREVAIKVLPDAFAQDAERLARFEREAKTLASLNHPNIAAIYGFEKSTGQHALVMELVEGEDLSQRIARGAIPVDEALAIARQIAQALEAAHEQGIVHRDLKPANIKVRADGTVKVLDFGLAKAMESGSGTGDPGFGARDRGLVHASQLPTVTTPALMTGEGVILGTAAYMSPEQAKGRPVDRRADIWAFGCVLFEMLTGTRAFRGDDVHDTFVAIMRDEPDWSRLPSTLSPSLSTFLKRCLHKDPKQRVPDIAAMRLALEGAFEAEAGRVPRSGTADDAGATGATDADTVYVRSMRRRGGLVGAAAAVVIIALAIPAVQHLRETPPPALPETRVEIVTPANADPVSFALSPDGRQIVFVASGDGASRLWLRSLASTTAQPLAGTEGAVHPFWSPDSRSVGFFAAGRLKRLGLGGGAPQTLATAPGGRGGTWNTDGVILFSGSSGSVSRVAASGGAAVAVTRLDRQTSHKFPVFLPDGRHFLFFAQGAPDTAGIYLGALESDETHRLTPADTRGVYLPSVPTEGTRSDEARRASEGGWLAWVRDGTLVAQRLDLAQQTLTGDPVILADRVVADTGINASAVSAAATGLLAYRTGRATRRQQLAWFDRSGKALGAWGVPDEDDLQNPSLSPDGQRVAVQRNAQGNADVWLLDAARMSRFTFDAALDRWPIWSSDGSRIVFASTRKGQIDLYQKPSSGAGAEALLVDSSQIKVASDWSAGGRFLIYFSIDPQTAGDLWVLPTGGDRMPWVFLKTGFMERWGQSSPDGRWVAYESNESGRDEIYIRPFAATAASGAGANPVAGQWQVSTAGGIHPRWRSDGRELYYIGPNGEMMAASIATTTNTVEPGAPVTLFSTRIFGGGADNALGRQYDVARDGRFLINTVLDDAASPITLIQNWTPNTAR